MSKAVRMMIKESPDDRLVWNECGRPDQGNQISRSVFGIWRDFFDSPFAVRVSLAPKVKERKFFASKKNLKFTKKLESNRINQR